MALSAQDGNIKADYLVNLTLSPALVAANTTAEQTFSLPGLILNQDFVVGISKPTAQAGLGIVGMRVTANDTLGITFSNNTGAGITPTASQVYTIEVKRVEGAPFSNLSR